ncbi:MCP four helix bundle domain-containing protein [Anaerorudis cellulosivorans]|uniref:MCP four helix bundle domain-containing protein n=1 Tax=Anaerorudis cellulosivorans TaxID=3397862 RepID=UPI00221EB4FB|nr:MCP four helix bundle domain-containing protein [Seramator thermalis]MCW1734092.1 MCP four helix bundle domain-containing protein [Seramator thermalis]
MKIANSLKTKISAGFLLLIFMLAIAGIMLVMEFEKVETSAETIINNNCTSIEQAQNMLNAMDQENKGLLLLLEGNREEGIKIIMTADSIMNHAIKIATQHVSEVDEEKYIEKIKDEYGKYYTFLLSFIEKDSITTPTESNHFFSTYQQLNFATKDAINTLLQLNEKGVKKQTLSMRDNAKRAIMPAIVSLITAAIFALLLNFFISEYLINPIRNITDAVSSFYPEQYNLKVTAYTKDEIKNLENEINNLIHRFLHIKNMMNDKNEKN